MLILVDISPHLCLYGGALLSKFNSFPFTMIAYANNSLCLLSRLHLNQTSKVEIRKQDTYDERRWGALSTYTVPCLMIFGRNHLATLLLHTSQQELNIKHHYFMKYWLSVMEMYTRKCVVLLDSARYDENLLTIHAYKTFIEIIILV